jgi:hypothetical protein
MRSVSRLWAALSSRAPRSSHACSSDPLATRCRAPTPGRGELEDLRVRYREMLRARLAGMSDEQVAALEAATEALDALVQALQPGGAK